MRVGPRFPCIFVGEKQEAIAHEPAFVAIFDNLFWLGGVEWVPIAGNLKAVGGWFDRAFSLVDNLFGVVRGGVMDMSTVILQEADYEVGTVKQRKEKSYKVHGSCLA